MKTEMRMAEEVITQMEEHAKKKKSEEERKGTGKQTDRLGC